MRLYLLRHGQVEGHQQRRYNGQVNVPLTALGEEQSRRLRDWLADKELAAVYSSDLDRCLYCAELIAAAHGLAVNRDVALRELHIGDWEGLTWEELQAAYPEAWQARLRDIVNFRFPGGESLQDAAERIRPVLCELLRRHPEEVVALAAHGGVNRVILLDALGTPLSRAFSVEQDYGCINIIDYATDGSATVRLLNGSVPLAARES